MNEGCTMKSFHLTCSPLNVKNCSIVKCQCDLSSSSMFSLMNRNVFGIFDISFHVRTFDELNTGHVSIHQVHFGMTKFC